MTSIAGPRTHHSAEIYNGAELQSRSARPGAYDAMAIPSRISGRLFTPTELHAELLTPAPVPEPSAPPRAPQYVFTSGDCNALQKSRNRRFTLLAAPPPGPAPLAPRRHRAPSVSGYKTREGSYPALVIAALKAEGGCLSYRDLADRFGVIRSSITAVFKTALLKGALVRCRLPGGEMGLSLPGYVPPPALERPSKALQRVQARLAKRRTQVAQLEAQVLALQAVHPVTATTE